MGRKFIMCAFVCVLVCGLVLGVQATDPEITTYTPSEKERALIVENTALELVADDSYPYALRGFGADDAGNYALAFAGNYVYVYNSSGEFLYGVHFKAMGVCGIDLCEKGLQIYNVRSEMLLTYDSTGNCVDVQKVAPKAAQSYLQSYLEKESKETACGTYRLERPLDIGSYYTKLVVTDPNGSETVLYDDPTGHYGEIVVFALTACILVFGAIATFKQIIRREDKKAEKQMQREDTTPTSEKDE